MAFTYILSSDLSQAEAIFRKRLSSWTDTRKVYQDGERVLWVKQDASTSVFDFPTGLIITDGEYLVDCKEKLAYSINQPKDICAETLSRICRGNAVVIFKQTGESLVLSDTLGSFPLFYGNSADQSTLIYSSHYLPVRKLSNVDIDFTGVYQYLAGGYTVGPRTLHAGISQFLPGEIHFLESATDPIQAHKTMAPSPWNTNRRKDLQQISLDDVLQALIKESARLENCQLMFSAGWDSRTILAGIIASGLEGSILAYSHGDTKSRELKIADKICHDYDIRRRKIELADLHLDLPTFDKALEDCSHILFPQWRQSAEFAKNTGRRSISAGIFGGILGGHYSVPSITKSLTSQVITLLRYLYLPYRFSCTGKMAMETGFHLLWNRSYINWWCLLPTVREEIRSSVMASNEIDIKNEIGRFYNSGVEDLEGLIEAFQVSHRGRQYMNGQLGICRSVIPIINPFTNEILVDFALSLNFHQKVHNQVNQKILRKMMPDLLHYPMAATLLNASFPIGLQELSRGGRKIIETVRWKLHQWHGGTHEHNPNMGWVNFEFLRSSPLLHDIIDSLISDFWDKTNMHQIVSNYPLKSMHPIYDMLNKIKTIDFRINT